jgi:hypothetical protein
MARRKIFRRLRGEGRKRFCRGIRYGRSTEAEAIEAKQMTMDEARRVASNIAKLPDMLKRGE